MAIVVRYFSTTSAGAADGTSWANRAALFSSGNWSSVITGFNFSGSDSLQALIGPGSYTCSQTLSSGLFANAPSLAKPLFLVACDSSGTISDPPDKAWKSSQPAWSTTSLPVITTTVNISSLQHCYWKLINITTSTNLTSMITNGQSMDWCQLSTSASAPTEIVNLLSRLSNCCFSFVGSSSYSQVIFSSGGTIYNNCRFVGVTGSSGNRRGVSIGDSYAGLITTIIGCTFYGFYGNAIHHAASSASDVVRIERCTILGSGSSGIQLSTTASQTAVCHILNNLIANNSAYGITGTNANTFASGNRLRDNSTANFNMQTNYPTDLSNYTASGTDANEFVDYAGGDYRVKVGSAIWGAGYGAGDQAASAGGLLIHPGMGGGFRG